MDFPTPLLTGTLIRRYKRFFADVLLDSGETVTAHCPNTGRMSTCAETGWKVALSPATNPKRKLAYTWELVHNGQCWICVNTLLANRVAAEGITAGHIPELAGYDRLLREQTIAPSCRIDLVLERPGERCLVEVKNVTLVGEDGAYCFPDAVTARGLKHLHELGKATAKGDRAVMLYVVQRSDGQGFRPAREIDPDYAHGLRKAAAKGVEIFAYRTHSSLQSVAVSEAVPVLPF
ncbi:MAG: DNA/RNA nuclease SfsA [Lentisphaerae bacterium]|jgi:sugar fermentation stimulation protein A|nr:DNA/RNA nuclease SfsA [Lentisphaerota bacterium]MBT4814499.1 DNA/RNA nuclease SfsA [Lentisphaerota bacterium]MBT5605216.1 DNA/RNA nuclease SfsA [Lentisphaerota bacterium]MBT7054332.1 DNA/RNA nuclease SfsA [Lentisphaerota bacterium]MBT7844884.1 DNA/RNA nuclease SfsA [Lentisphaerota bacterium]